jgi:hypothetical protein
VVVPKPTLDDLAFAQANFLTFLERAELDTVIALRDHMQASPHSKRVRMKCLIALIQAEIDRRTGYAWENRKRVVG